MPYQTISQRPSTPHPSGQSSPGYVGFSRILDANRPGAKRMADKLAQGVQEKGQQTQQAIQGAAQDFEKQVKAGTLSYQPIGSINRGASAAQGGGYAQAGAALGPQANPNRREYVGPKDYAGAGINTAALTDQATRAGDAARGLTSMGGRASQLRAGVSGPYGAGMSTLDAALSGAALGGRGQEISAMYGNLNDQLTQARARGDALVTGAQASSNAAVKRMEDDIRGMNSQPTGTAVPLTPPPPNTGHVSDYMGTPGASPVAGDRPTTPPPGPDYTWIPGRGWVSAGGR